MRPWQPGSASTYEERPAQEHYRVGALEHFMDTKTSWRSVHHVGDQQEVWLDLDIQTKPNEINRCERIEQTRTRGRQTVAGNALFAIYGWLVGVKRSSFVQRRNGGETAAKRQ